jgi:hypothetical protein
MIYKIYTGTKPPPKWLGYMLFWLFFFPIMLGYAAWGWIKLAFSRRERGEK